MTLAFSASSTAFGLAVAAMTLCGVATTAAAHVIVSANDNKLTLNDGVQTVMANPPSDTVTVRRDRCRRIDRLRHRRTEDRSGRSNQAHSGRHRIGN